MPVSCCGTLHLGSSPRRSVHSQAGIRTCLSQPHTSVGLRMLRTAFSLEGVEERDEEQEDDGEDQRDGGIPFIINRGGLPINEETWDQMWRHVARIHPDGEALGRRIRGTSDLPKIPVPSVPTFQASSSVPHRLEAIQRYIRDLQYNHTGTQFFEIKKSRPLTALMDIAKEMTRESLPIKCLEAVILGIVAEIHNPNGPRPLTNAFNEFNNHGSLPQVGLVSLSPNSAGVHLWCESCPTLGRIDYKKFCYFLSHLACCFIGSHFHHIVLGVHSGGRFGALGISRRDDLMYKPLEYRTLSDLLQEFQAAYQGYWHTLCKVKIGHYVSHDLHSVEQIEWKHSVLDVDKLSKEELRKELERHTRDMRLKIGKAGPPSPSRDRRKDMGSPLRNPGSPRRKNSQTDRRPSVEKRTGTAADLNGYQIRV